MLLQMALFHIFLWLSNMPLCVSVCVCVCLCVYHIFCFHSSINGHLGCFHVLAIANSASVNIGVHVSFQVRVFSGGTRGPAEAGSCCQVVGTKPWASGAILDSPRPWFLPLWVILLCMLEEGCT